MVLAGAAHMLRSAASLSLRGEPCDANGRKPYSFVSTSSCLPNQPLPPSKDSLCFTRTSHSLSISSPAMPSLRVKLHQKGFLKMPPRGDSASKLETTSATEYSARSRRSNSEALLFAASGAQCLERRSRNVRSLRAARRSGRARAEARRAASETCSKRRRCHSVLGRGGRDGCVAGSMSDARKASGRPGTAVVLQERMHTKVLGPIQRMCCAMYYY